MIDAPTAKHPFVIFLEDLAQKYGARYATVREAISPPGTMVLFVDVDYFEICRQIRDEAEGERTAGVQLFVVPLVPTIVERSWIRKPVSGWEKFWGLFGVEFRSEVEIVLKKGAL